MAAPQPRTVPGRRPRPRRGSFERPVSGRIYRATWSLVALPLLVLAFTVGRPDPLQRPDLPPSFDVATANRLAEELAHDFPNRSPGGTNHDGAARWVAGQLEAFGLDVRVQRFRAEIEGLGEVSLANVIASPRPSGPARSSRTIVVMADRDNLGLSQGLDDNASGTGAMLELARDLSSITVSHTIVFASTDGGAFGNLGAEALARDPEFRRDVLAVVNLDSIGGAHPPRLELAGEGGRSPASVLAATADASVLRQTGLRARRDSGFLQLLDLAFPASPYGQAPLLGHGVSAITLTTAGDRPPAAASDPPRLDTARLAAVGQAAQALVQSLDKAGDVASGTESYLYFGGRVLRGFAIAFLLVVCLVPPLAATIDLLARLRRRGLALAPALRSYRSRLGVWLWGGALAALFTAAGLFPDAGDRPLPPTLPAAQDWPSAALAGLAVLVGGGWFLARVRLVPRTPTERSDELAGHLAGMLALCAIGILVAIVDTYALLFVLPSLHAWLWVPHVRDRPVWVRALLLLAGLAGPIVLVGAFAGRFHLGFDAPWYVATLFTTGYAPWTAFLLLLAWGAVAGQMGAILFGRYAPYPSEGERPERGIVREGVRQSVLLWRRARRRRPDRPAAGEPARRSRSAES